MHLQRYPDQMYKQVFEEGAAGGAFSVGYHRVNIEIYIT